MSNLNVEQIKVLIEEKNKTIESLLEPGVFVLNHQIIELTKDIKNLQNQCLHSFVGGYCEYCNKKENN